MGTTEIMVLAAAVLIVVIFLWRVLGPRRPRRLREQSGHGKVRAVIEFRNRRKCLNIRPLAPRERERFLDAWKLCQSRFVDDPRATVADAERLVSEAMTIRGYPVAEFEMRAADLSLEHPHVVTHYRAARAIVLGRSEGAAGTEHLRQAFVHYRSLFDEVLERYLVGGQIVR